MQTAISYLHTFAQVFIYLYIAAVVLRALGSWFVLDDRWALVGFLFDVTEPVLAPMRRVVPRILGVDFAPMIAILGLFIAGQFLG